VGGGVSLVVVLLVRAGGLHHIIQRSITCHSPLKTLHWLQPYTGGGGGLILESWNHICKLDKLDHICKLDKLHHICKLDKLDPANGSVPKIARI